MRWALIFGVALGLTGCGASEPPAGGAPVTQLTVRLDHDGAGPDRPHELRLRCDAASDSRECAAATDLRPADFAPVARHRVCTDVYGGPETARVSGQLRGRPVAGDFRRANGCEIARWRTIAALLAQVP